MYKCLRCHRIMAPTAALEVRYTRPVVLAGKFIPQRTKRAPLSRATLRRLKLDTDPPPFND